MKTHQPCPDCGHKGCLTVFDDGGTYCHSCGKSFHKRFSWDKVQELKKTLEVNNDVEVRGINKATLEKLNCKTYVDKKGNPVLREYNYPLGPKYRVFPKSFVKKKGIPEVDFFGADVFNAGSASKIHIVEGEEDVLAFWQMTRQPVIGIPGASSVRKLIERNKKYLDSFDEIVLVLDNDKPGEKAEEVFLTVFPSKVKKVYMTKHKDPSDFLQAGDIVEFKRAVASAKRLVPQGYYATIPQFESIIKNPDGFSYVEVEHYELSQKIKGIVRGVVTVVTGQEGLGKTEVLRFFEWNVLKNSDEPIACLHLEEGLKTSLLTMACYTAKENLRFASTDEEYSKAVESLQKHIGDDRMVLMDWSSSNNTLDILDKIRYVHGIFGVNYFFIDPIQDIAHNADIDGTTSLEQVLSDLSTRLANLAKELNIAIVVTAHVNDDGQVRSSRMIAKRAGIRLDLDRNLESSDPDERNMTKIKVTKNRPFAVTGYAGALEFDPKTFTLKESSIGGLDE